MTALLNAQLRPRLGGGQNAREISPSVGRARHHCRHCQVDVSPKIDDQGPYCPYCQLNLPSPMERGKD
jgi:hypothetical protein